LATHQPMLARWTPGWLKRRIATAGFNSPHWLVQFLVHFPQWIETARRRDQRRALLAQDLQIDRERMFGGPGE
jgi:hypothetical protein